MAMRPDEKKEFRDLILEITECAKQNSKEESPVLPTFKEGITTIRELIFISTAILGLLIWIFTVKADVNTNTTGLSDIKIKQTEMEKRLWAIELKINKLEK